MARLPGDRFLIQQIDGQVVLFEDGTEREIIRFIPGDPISVMSAQSEIHFNEDLNPEEKSFAHFWSGYFYAHGGGG